MNILLVTQYFYPENFKSNDIAFELVKRGHKIHVLTGIPNYPDGVYYKGYGLFTKNIETVNKVKIYRAFQLSRGRNNKLRLTLNYLSFVLFGSLWAVFIALINHYDCIIVHAPSPITQVIPGVVVKRLKKIPLYIWVLDLWPEAMQSGAGISNNYILSFVDKVVKYIYNNTTKILISSQEFGPKIAKKGNYIEKIKYFPNWSEDLLNMPQDYPIPSLPKGFIIMLAGNLGISQDLEAVMKVAIEMKNDKNIKWVLIGDGSQKKYLDDSIIAHNLKQNVFTFGRFPLKAMPSFYKAASAMLLTLSGKHSDLKMVVPARLQSYMAAGRPVLAMIDGAAASLIQETNCGYAVNGGDYFSLATIIREKVLPDLEAFEKLGGNGRNYFEKHFQKDNCINNLCEIINQ